MLLCVLFYLVGYGIYFIYYQRLSAIGSRATIKTEAKRRIEAANDFEISIFVSGVEVLEELGPVPRIE